MRLIGKIKSATTDTLTVEIDGSARTINEITEFGDDLLVFAISKYHGKRSISANGYFWVLVNQIAEKLGTDKESIYMWMIRDAGVSVPIRVIADAMPTLNKTFRLVEEIGRVSDGEREMVECLCYYGSSTYDSKEMSRLIDYTKQEAKALGCDVWTDEEIRRLCDDANKNDIGTSS